MQKQIKNYIKGSPEHQNVDDGKANQRFQTCKDASLNNIAIFLVDDFPQGLQNFLLQKRRFKENINKEYKQD